MPRPRKSVAELKCLGTYRKDRHKHREPDEDAALIPSQPIGKPPEYFAPELVAIWDELKGAIPKHSTVKSDRFLLEQACGLLARQRDSFQKGDPLLCKAADLAILNKALVTLGVSLEDRKRIAPPPPKKRNTDDWLA
jgi:hypothetical protein